MRLTVSCSAVTSRDVPRRNRAAVLVGTERRFSRSENLHRGPHLDASKDRAVASRSDGNEADGWIGVQRARCPHESISSADESNPLFAPARGWRRGTAVPRRTEDALDRIVESCGSRLGSRRAARSGAMLSGDPSPRVTLQAGLAVRCRVPYQRSPHRDAVRSDFKAALFGGRPGSQRPRARSPVRVPL